MFYKKMHTDKFWETYFISSLWFLKYDKFCMRSMQNSRIQYEDEKGQLQKTWNNEDIYSLAQLLLLINT